MNFAKAGSESSIPFIEIWNEQGRVRIELKEMGALGISIVSGVINQSLFTHLEVVRKEPMTFWAKYIQEQNNEAIN